MPGEALSYPATTQVFRDHCPTRVDGPKPLSKSTCYRWFFSHFDCKSPRQSLRCLFSVPILTELSPFGNSRSVPPVGHEHSTLPEILFVYQGGLAFGHLVLQYLKLVYFWRI